MPHLLHRFIASFLPCLIAVTLASGQRSLPGKYSVTDLGTLSGNTYSEGLGINVWGHIVGCSGQPGYACENAFNFQFTDGFVWTGPGSITAMMPLPGGTLAYSSAINDSGWITGTSSGAFQALGHATLWKSTGEVLDLGTVDKQCSDACASYGVAINDIGMVVGTSDVPPLDNSRAFLWTEGSGMLNLGTLGSSTSSATAVNHLGSVAGYLNILATGTNAFFWTPRDGMLDLGVLKGATSQWSIALGVNDSDEVVGQSAYAGGDFTFFHAFLWTKTQGMQDLGVLEGPYNSSEAMAINDRGEIVGWSGNRAFIWSSAEGMKDLNNYIDPNSGWILNSANAINIRGRITGSGSINGETHAFLLTPLYQED